MQLENSIKSDSNFLKITQLRTRERYLKDILKGESDEVLSYFDMKRRSDGSITSNSLAGQQFINKIWDELHKI